MADLREVPRPVTVTPDTSLAELAVALELLNIEAKIMSRRGKAFDDDTYAAWHQRIDQVLDDYCDAVSRFSQTATNSNDEQRG